MDTITFTELVKMIHPDVNPHITNPGEKMSQVTSNRNNPSKLFELAVTWGLVTPSKNYSFSRSEEKKVYWFEVGNVVVYSKNKRAVITDIQNGKGKRKGQLKVHIVDIERGRVLYFFIPRKDFKLSGIEVIGKSSDYNKSVADKIYQRYIDSKKFHEQRKEDIKKEREEKAKVNLDQDRYYGKNSNIWVVSKTRNGTFQVIRTTKKRVYYWDEYQDKERYFSFSSVIHVFRG